MPAEATQVLLGDGGPRCLDALHALLESLWVEAPAVTDRDRIAFTTAVAEVVANVVEHATLAQPVPVRVVLQSADDELRALLEDTGLPFDPPVDESPGPLAESGRGLPMARALVDELLYERDGPINRWLVVRRRGA